MCLLVADVRGGLSLDGGQRVSHLRPALSTALGVHPGAGISFGETADDSSVDQS